MPGSIFISPICAQAPPCNAKEEEEFIDHYAILGLGLWATTEEIMGAFRELRCEYIRTDVSKYRALVAAYEVLVYQEVRYNYDVIYCQHMGLPLPPPPPPPSPSLSPSPAPCAKPVLAPSVPALPTPKSPAEVEVNEEEVRAKELAEKRKHDPNYALKHYRPMPAPPTLASPVAVEMNKREVCEEELAEKRKRDPNYALKRYQPMRKPAGGLQPSMRPTCVPRLNGHKKKTHSQLKYARLLH